jgi:uncharacterized membrane protein
MSFLEKIGEVAIGFLSKVFYHSIGFLIKIIESTREINKRLKLGERINFYPFFEKRGVELKDYIVLKNQLSTLFFLVFAVFYIFELLGFKSLIFFLLVLGSYSLFLTFSLREHFSDDFPAYRDFFLSYLGIATFLVVVKQVKPRMAVGFPFFHLFVLSIVLVVLVSFVFKRRYGRDYTFGRVIERKGGLIKVKVNYDICSSVKPGVHTFRGNAKKGDVVKLRTERGFFNLRGSRVVEIIDQ